MLHSVTPISTTVNATQATANISTYVLQGAYTAIGVTTTNGPNSNASTDWVLLVGVTGNVVSQSMVTQAGTYQRSYAGGTWGSWTLTEGATYATSAQGAKADTALQPVVAGAGISGGGFAKHALVAGGAAGDITVAAIKVGDELNEVIYFVGAGVAVTNVSDLTAEFTVAAGKINNTGGTASTGGNLLVRWTKLTT